MASYSERELQELGDGVARIVSRPVSSSEKSLLKDTSERERKTVERELVYLRAFALDAALWTVLGDSGVRAKLLDAAYTRLASEGHITYDTLNERLRDYGEALREYGFTEQLISGVGNVFSHHCSSVPARWVAELEFSVAFRTLVETLGKTGAE